MVKVVYNGCFGGFGVSKKAARALKKVGIEVGEYGYLPEDVKRHDPRLVAVVEKLGKAASGMGAKLDVKTLKGSCYRIEEYDGAETVVEPDDLTWVVVTQSA